MTHLCWPSPSWLGMAEDSDDKDKAQKTLLL
eukprot:CAMPEP_0116567002 /NCGR_PEP_ID=MMETSP0397-20121206/14764_1 /TAXON_ID=216820 /ORGANISM="Cyclophora tenuis, Strain ECT3854" /LENGTH=30 /DNA_ID= /DNA_START= /DNA_END= /DNA_ORIENTATION=